MNARQTASYDRFTDTKINATESNTLPNHFPEQFDITLDMRQQIQGGVTNYFLTVGCVSASGVKFFPAIGQSLFVLADDSRYAFQIGAMPQSGAFANFHFYPASEDQIRHIASAKSVEVRLVSITGKNWERKLAEKNLSVFRGFLEKYLPQ